MKDKMKGLIIGLTIGTMLSGTAAWAAGTQIEVAFRNLKYMFDGVEKVPSDGKSFIYEGTTYVPIRFVSEALGKPVEWDEANETIWIGNNPTHIIATYQGGQVTKGQFDNYLAIQVFFNSSYSQYKGNSEFEQFILKQLLKDAILSGRATDVQRDEASQKAKKQLDAWKLQGADQLSSSLKAANITEADVTQFLIHSFLADSIISSTVTEDRLQQQYKDNLAGDPNYYTTASVRHILIGLNDSNSKPLRTKEEALKRAQEVQTKLKNGGDFAALAKEYSEDPGSKDNGGLYESAFVNKWVAEFKQAALELKIGQISDPVATTYGYHVMKVESRTVQTFENAKPDLFKQFSAEAMDTFLQNELPGLIEKNELQK
jgi:foldase protein PrsA